MEKRWIEISAKDQKLGRLATKVAMMLTGKDQPTFRYNIGATTHVVITNCDEVTVPEIRLNEPLSHHTGYIGNLKTTSRAKLKSTEIVRRAVSGMLPKNKTRRELMRHLHCEAGQDHLYKQHLND